MPIKTQNQRNPVARAAILRKGGVHEKCRTSKRQQQKRELEDAVSAYYLSVGSSYDNGVEPDDVPDKFENKNRGNSSPVLNTDRDNYENNYKDEVNTKKTIENNAFLSIYFLFFRTVIPTYSCNEHLEQQKHYLFVYFLNCFV